MIRRMFDGCTLPDCALAMVVAGLSCLASGGFNAWVLRHPIGVDLRGMKLAT